MHENVMDCSNVECIKQNQTKPTPNETKSKMQPRPGPVVMQPFLKGETGNHQQVSSMNPSESHQLGGGANTRFNPDMSP